MSPILGFNRLKRDATATRWHPFSADTLNSSVWEHHFVFAAQFFLDLVEHQVEVRGVVDEVEMVAGDREDRAQVKPGQPFGVQAVKQVEIVGGDTGFHGPAAAADAAEQGGGGGFQVQQQVRARQAVHHQVEQALVGAVVALAQVAQGAQGAGKDVVILEDAAVADGAVGRGGQGAVLLGAVPQEKDLQVKRPLGHVGVEVGQVRVVVDRLEG